VFRTLTLLPAVFLVAALLTAQKETEPPQSGPTLRINSRAVLVDVIVTDAHGNPVPGLSRDAFSVTEQGKPQTVSFFEEHRAGAQPQQQPAALPKLPANVFTNFSPYAAPPAVNVLLLDSLNTRMESQSYVHAQAVKFLKTAKPGSRMAIFAMGLGLHFVQGFTDDPALLAAALGNRKNNEVGPTVMLKGQDETNAQQNVLAMMNASEGNGATAGSANAIAALQSFFQENDDSRTTDRALITLMNLQRLATFLNSFPGRKNVIWFSQAFPLVISGHIDPQIGEQTQRTLDMLAAARVALYPVDAGGTSVPDIYTAQMQLPTVSDAAGMLAAQKQELSGEGQQRNDNQSMMKMAATATGGKAFVNSNGMAQIIGDIATTSGDFYTLSYTPTNLKMDGTYRAIEVKAKGGDYRLSYRRGYLAAADDLPGSGEMLRAKAIHRLAEKNPGAVDPLLPFMDLGMPQSEQILIEARIQPVPLGGKPEPGDPKGAAARYQMDLALDTKDLRLPVGSDGLHAGTVYVSLVAYDRYGAVVSRKDHRVELHIKPDAWAAYQNSGVQLHADIAVPKGNYWLRTGVYDEQSRKVGTMEIPLGAVQAVSAAVQQPKAGK
jgi:VWFA-related protein